MAIGQLKNQMNQIGAARISMRLRLFIFLMILVLTMFLGIVAILFFSGAFNIEFKESNQLLERELDHCTQDVSQSFGQCSVQAVELAKNVAESIEQYLSDHAKTFSDLQADPQLQEDIILTEFEKSLFALEKSKCSGVFIILDATVNPSLPNAQNSRMGLYIKNMEPNILNASLPNLFICGGIRRSGVRIIFRCTRMEHGI
jgi:hypothetical protein